MVVDSFASGRFEEASVLPRGRHRFARRARQQLRRNPRPLQPAHQAGASSTIDQERVDHWIEQGRAAVRLGPHADRRGMPDAAPPADAGRRRRQPARREPRTGRRRGARARAGRPAGRGQRHRARARGHDARRADVAPGDAGQGDRPAGPHRGGAAHAGGDGRRAATARRSTLEIRDADKGRDVDWDDDGARRAHRPAARHPRPGDRQPGHRFSARSGFGRARELFIASGDGAIETLTIDDGRGSSRAGRSIGFAGVDDDERRARRWRASSCGCRPSSWRRCRRARSTGTTWSAAEVETVGGDDGRRA